MAEGSKLDTPRNRLRWRLEYGAVRALALLLAAAPHGLRLILGRAIGWLTFFVDRRHARVALANLRAAYPEADGAWQRRTARASFQHLGRLLVEILAQPRLLPRLEELLDVQGLDHLRRLTGTGRGYFLLSGHFGNWEWVALQQAVQGFPLWMITRPLDNPHLEKLLAQRRTATGNRVVHKRNAVREMVKAIRHGRGVAIVIDQHFLSPSAHLVPFFGRLAATTPTLGTLVCRLGVPVLPVFSYPLPGGRYRVVYEEPILPPNEPDQETAARLLTLEATARIEAAIRRHPSAWFWMHDRWRTAPSDGGGLPVQHNRSVT